MTYMNLIYLGVITNRVPIIAMFTPSHIGGDAPLSTFGEVFDVPRFIKESGTPLLEWLDVKDPESDQLESLGCWNVWEAVQYYEHYPRNSFVPQWLNLGLSLYFLLTITKLNACHRHLVHEVARLDKDDTKLRT